MSAERVATELLGGCISGPGATLCLLTSQMSVVLSMCALSCLLFGGVSSRACLGRLGLLLSALWTACKQGLKLSMLRLWALVQAAAAALVCTVVLSLQIAGSADGVKRLWACVVCLQRINTLQSIRLMASCSGLLLRGVVLRGCHKWWPRMSGCFAA